jgi:preprotein translocase subunit SecG
VFEQLKKDSRPNEPSSGLNDHRGRSIPVAMLLILVVLVSAGSGVYAGASFHAQQAPNVTVTTTIYTTTTSWATSTFWSTVTSVVEGVWTTVEYTTSTSTVTVTGLDTYTKLLLHMDGTDGSQTFIDSSPQAHSITAKGNAQIDTAQSKFGGASGLFDGTNDWVQTAANDVDFDFGSGAFTIEVWMKYNAGSGYQGLLSLCAWGEAAYGNAAWLLSINVANHIEFVATAGSAWDVNINTATTNVRDGAWHHIAVVRNGNSWNVYVDGVSEGSATSSITINAPTGRVFSAGRHDWQNDMNGWLDEVRISKGIASWTSNFTPPAAPYG